MRPQKRSIRHDGHPQCHPKEKCRKEAPPTVVLGVVLVGVLNDADVDEAADEEEKDGEVVSAPEEGHALVVEIYSLFFFGPRN